MSPGSCCLLVNVSPVQENSAGFGGGCTHVWRPEHLLPLSTLFLTQKTVAPTTSAGLTGQHVLTLTALSTPAQPYYWAVDVHPRHQGFYTRSGNLQQLLCRLAVSPPQMAGSDYKDHSLNQISLGGARAAVEGRLQFPPGEQSLTPELQACSLPFRAQHKLACTCLHASLWSEVWLAATISRLSVLSMHFLSAFQSSLAAQITPEIAHCGFCPGDSATKCLLFCLVKSLAFTKTFQTVKLTTVYRTLG